MEDSGDIQHLLFSQIKLRLPKRDDGVADMLRQRFCDEDSEDRWQTGLEIEAQE